MKTVRFTPGDLLKPFSRKQVLTKAELSCEPAAVPP